jgi:hypothetical protein
VNTNDVNSQAFYLTEANSMNADWTNWWLVLLNKLIGVDGPLSDVIANAVIGGVALIVPKEDTDPALGFEDSSVPLWAGVLRKAFRPPYT